MRCWSCVLRSSGRRFWAISLIVAMTVFVIYFSSCGGLKDLIQGISEVIEPSQVLIKDQVNSATNPNDRRLRNQTEMNFTEARRNKEVVTMEADRTWTHIDQPKEQMPIWNSLGVEFNKFLNSYILGREIRPKFRINRGDRNSKKYFNLNKKSLLANIEIAVDAGCMNGWSHRQTTFVQFGQIPSRETIIGQSKNLIVWYQMEQQGCDAIRMPNFQRAMNVVEQVWDFSYYNAEIFTKQRYVIYVPLWTTLHHSLFHNHVADSWKWDVLLYGALNERRKRICQELKERKLRVKCSGKLWGRDLENVMRQSQLLLNVHFYIPAALEVHRINPALADGMVVVSETGNDTKLDNVYADVATFAPFGELVNTVEATLRLSKKELAAKRISNQEWMRERSTGVDPQLCFALTKLVEAANKKFSPKRL